MKALGSAIPIATIALMFAGAALHPAAAFGPPPPAAVPEPSPAIGIGAGLVVLGLFLFLRQKLASRRAQRTDS